MKNDNSFYKPSEEVLNNAVIKEYGKK